MGNMIAYVEVTWNEKENNNNFGYRFEVPIPLTFTTESEAAKKKFAFFIRKDGIEICDEKFATVGFCPCTEIIVHPFRKAKTEFSSYEMKNIMSKLDFTLSEVDNSATVSYSKAYQDVKANKRKWGEYRTYKWKTKN